MWNSLVTYNKVEGEADEPAGNKFPRKRTIVHTAERGEGNPKMTRSVFLLTPKVTASITIKNNVSVCPEVSYVRLQSVLPLANIQGVIKKVYLAIFSRILSIKMNKKCRTKNAGFLFVFLLYFLNKNLFHKIELSNINYF